MMRHICASAGAAWSGFAALAISLGAVAMPAPASAEIVRSSDRGFITRDVAYVSADLKQTWLALITPAKWWSSQHTWSADAANLMLTPQAGGCFCETIPEVDEPGRFTLQGSVEHMRVIQAYPESALRMVGALGPLQSEPVTGVLTIALSSVDTPTGRATRIVWEYNVGGSMRYEVPVISKAVDGVMSLQLAGLADMLGRVEMPEDEAPAAQPSETAPSETAPSAPRPSKPGEGESAAPALINPEATLREGTDTNDADQRADDFRDAFDGLGDRPGDGTGPGQQP